MSSNEMQAKKAAQRLHRDYGPAPIIDLVQYIENVCAAEIMVVDAPNGEHGLTVKDESTGRLYIAVAATAHPMRWRSNLAHELAYVVFDDYDLELPSDPSARTPSEIRADAFARHLLIPEEMLSHECGGKYVSLSDFSDAVRKFRVSPQMAAVAFKSAGLIAEAKYDEWKKWTTKNLATRFGWLEEFKLAAIASNTPRAPRQLMARALNGYIEGAISASEIALLKNEKLADVRRDLDEGGIEPKSIDVKPEGKFPEVDAEFLAALDELDTELN